MKFDGYRAQVAISGSEVVIYTRNGHDWTRQFKVILPPLQALTKGSALIDGEIVAIDSQGRTNFSMLKTGIAAGMPLKFYAFDLLELNGEDLSNRPLLQRKERLEALLGTRDPGDSLQFSSHIVDHGKTGVRCHVRGRPRRRHRQARRQPLHRRPHRQLAQDQVHANDRSSWSAATAQATAAAAWPR